MDDQQNQLSTEPLVTVDQVEQIRTDEVKFQTTITNPGDLKKELIKKIIIYSCIGIVVIGSILYFILRPKDYIVYQKYQKIINCSKTKKICTERLTLRESGSLVYSGKITKRTKISQKNVTRVKQIIRSSGIMTAQCSAGPVLTNDNLTRTFIIDGTKRVIKSPGCDSEMDGIEAALSLILKY